MVVGPPASAPPAAPLPRRSEAEAFWNSISRGLTTAVLQSVPAFLLRTPGGAPPLEKEKGTGYFSEDFPGRPRGRSVEASPSVVAMCCYHSVVPKGAWRWTQVRSVVTS